MKIEDCEVGMKVKDKRGDEYIIKEIKDEKIKLENVNYMLLPNPFEPVNKFEVGDKIKRVENFNNSAGVKLNRGEVYTIKEFDYSPNIVKLEEVDGFFALPFFELVRKGEDKMDKFEVGVKVRCKTDRYSLIGKNKDYTISEIDKNRNKIALQEPCTINCNYHSKYFELINKFEVDEKVKWENSYGYEDDAIIFGIADEKDYHGDKYAITVIKDDMKINRVVKESELSKIKSMEDLEKGDKIEGSLGSKYEILAKEKDEYSTLIKFFVKDIKTGKIKIIDEKGIKEIL